jgi:hypothetical protein
MAGRFFIAHSSYDKDLALALYDELKGDAWVDLHEIEVGDIVLEEISEGIEAATDFVLLYSHHSADSPWVRFEFHMAFIRYLEDNAISIRVVVLDGTKLPLHLRPFHQARDLSNPKDIAAALLGTPPRLARLKAFVNRNGEVDVIESALYSASQGVVWLWGVRGIGKRSVAREAIARLMGAQGQARRIAVPNGATSVELLLSLRSALGAEIPSGPVSVQEALDLLHALLADFVRGGGVWIFEDAQTLLEEDAGFSPLLLEMFRSLEGADIESASRLAIVTSTRKPVLPDEWNGRVRLLRIGGLTESFGMALLRARGATGEEAVLRVAVRQVDGHPLALELAAPKVGAEEIDWEAERLNVASQLVADAALSPGAERLLEAVSAVDGPLPGKFLAEHLGVGTETFQGAVSEGVSCSLLEVGGGGDYLRVHPLVRDFYLRSLRRREDHIGVLSDLADRSLAHLKTLHPQGGTYVGALLATFRLLGLSYRLNEALSLRRDLLGVVYDSGVQLYHQRESARALSTSIT